jgi:hypothetical protein
MDVEEITVTAILQGVFKMEAGSEQWKKLDDVTLLLVVCRWLSIR